MKTRITAKNANILFISIIIINYFVYLSFEVIELPHIMSIQLSIPLIFYGLLFISRFEGKILSTLLRFMLSLNMLSIIIAINHIIDFIWAYEAPGFYAYYVIKYIIISNIAIYIVLNISILICYNLNHELRLFTISIIGCQLTFIILSIILNEVYFFNA